MEKLLISRLVQRNYKKMNSEHLIMLESREQLKDCWEHVKRIQNPGLHWIGQTWVNLSNKTNNDSKNYNTLNKIEAYIDIIKF